MEEPGLAEGQPPEDQWPSVERAYEFVQPTYDLVQRRLDSVHSNIQALQAYIATITVAAPILGTAIVDQIEFTSRWFIAAIALFLTTVVFGGLVRQLGHLKVVSPAKLYDGWLHYTDWEFRKNMLYWAGKDYKQNVALVNRKGWAAFVMTLGFAAEVALLVVWVLSER